MKRLSGIVPLRPANLPSWIPAASATGLMACQLDEAKRIELPGSRLTRLRKSIWAIRAAFLFAVPIAVKDDLYGVMLIEEAAGRIAFPRAPA